MKFDISVHPGARTDTDDAYEYYVKEASLTVADEFLAALDESIALIMLAPSSFVLVLGVYRKVQLHRFPFTVYFKSNGSEIRILAVAHHRRKPFYWLGRE